jgi:hypothetical protein
LSELLSAVLSITNTTGSAGHVLHIVITGTGFTAPTAPPAISALSHIGGTAPTTSSNNTLAFQSFVQGTGFGAQNPDISTGASFSSDRSTLISSLAAPFSIQEKLDLVLNGNGDTLNYSSSTTLTPTPTPASLVLALAGLPVVGWNVWRRRRATKVEAA